MNGWFFFCAVAKSFIKDERFKSSILKNLAFPFFFLILTLSFLTKLIDRINLKLTMMKENNFLHFAAFSYNLLLLKVKVFFFLHSNLLPIFNEHFKPAIFNEINFEEQVLTMGHTSWFQYFPPIKKKIFSFSSISHLARFTNVQRESHCKNVRIINARFSYASPNDR